MNKPISNATGIYFKEIDNTIVTQSVGTFAGAILGTTQKGPAFEIMPSSTFAEREVRMGGLNSSLLSDRVTLKYPSGYYALNFLSQANNLKEVRVLGLEGYNELQGNNANEAADTNFPDGGKNKNGTDLSFVIMYDSGSVSAALPEDGPYETPAIADVATIAAILKPRRASFTGANTIAKINISGNLTDDSFTVTIVHTDTPNPNGDTSLTVECSLRPGSKNYICNIFGTDPLDNTKLNGVPSPIWVDYIFPSVQSRNSMKPYLNNADEPVYTRTTVPNPGYELGYRLPSSSPSETEGANTSLEILGGDCVINSNFLGYPEKNITQLLKTGGDFNPVLTFTSASHGYTAGQRVTLSGLPYSALNKTWKIASTPAVATNTFSVIPSAAEYAAVTLAISGTASPANVGDWKTQRKSSSVWEQEVMNLGGEIAPLSYRTPVTPWFVSDADINGNVKRLFRIWSISDGHEANTEIKIEISNINQAANGGDGSFDIIIRDFNDTEETKVIRGGFSGLSLNPRSDNYIAAKIGDGEAYPLKSKYIFVEMNQDDVTPIDALPYGCEGYPNVDGMVLPDVQWTTEYNLSQPNAKQILGLANNSVNMQKKLTEDYLSFKNVQLLDTTNTGKGFHLNPTGQDINTSLFEVAKTDIYNKSSVDSTALGGTDKAKRNKFVVAFYGGFDGWNVYSERSWGDPQSLDYSAFQRGLAVLNDKESLDADFSVLVTPDINFELHSSAARAALDMVESREDAIYLNDFAYDSTGVCDPDVAKLSLQGSDMLSNYCATYFPYWQIKDTVNKVNPWIAPSFIAYGTIASVATKENVWLPPAGSLRTMSDYLVRPRRRMKQEDRAILEGANINPITIFPGSGIEITDSKTTQEANSALSYIHNRMLLNYAKKVLNQTLRPLLQQLNSQALRDAFENTLFPIFDRIKKLNGLQDFKVTVTDVIEDRTVLYGTITITPLYPVRQISLTFQLDPSGVTFS